MISSSVFALLASAALVASHGIVDEVTIGNVKYPGTKNYNAPENAKSPVRGIPSDTGFVHFANVGSPDIACSSAGRTPRTVTPEIAAGSPMGVRWGGDGGPDKKQWPHPEGPAIVYMASCNGKCSDFDPVNAQFFKIAEEGLDPNKRPNESGNDHLPWGQGLWAQNRIQYENSYHWFNIPSDIKAGEYLVRHELISLHGAHSAAEGAQYYPACIQVKVTGGGNASPPTTPATKLYSYQDGIVDIYTPSQKTNGMYGITAAMYKIPGPALYVPGKAPAQPVTSAAPSSTAAPATSAAAVTSAAPYKPPANNNPPVSVGPITSVVYAPAPAPTSTRRCKPKRAMHKRVEDETREIYDRALAHAQGAHAHAKKRSSH
ncbi:glycoside hydrolase family 61 protein [Rhizoctonia solani AG-3 Rhs1AP]|uniref:lytic cellulose monooxygenase (C4-dehydrogenating) n=1 Tax=Rhizoctonia solani AG-3 Rhs1AP TaxID=1086054 RepID=X8JAC7_9AGAM|nr:glycoside hydrolase family 61 protein [Rhizoctonia solani AG-3 Rhs1AP]